MLSVVKLCRVSLFYIKNMLIKVEVIKWLLEVALPILARHKEGLTPLRIFQCQASASFNFTRHPASIGSANPQTLLQYGFASIINFSVLL